VKHLKDNVQIKILLVFVYLGPSAWTPAQFREKI